MKETRGDILDSESDPEENSDSDYVPEDSPKRKRGAKTTAKGKTVRKTRTKVDKNVVKRSKRTASKTTKRGTKHTDSDEEDAESKPKRIKLDEGSAGNVASNKISYEDEIEVKPRKIKLDEESASTSQGVKKYNYEDDYEFKSGNVKPETELIGNFSHGYKSMVYKGDMEYKSDRVKLEEDFDINELHCKSEPHHKPNKPDLKARSKANNDKSKISAKKEEQKYEVKGLVNADWDEAEEIAEDLRLPYYIVKNVIRLFNEDNTIPFIARYRKEMTGNMDPEKLREVKEAYETLQNVKKKAATMINAAMKLGKLTKGLEYEILSARTMSELDHIYSSFKASGKGTLAERARELGLETPALTILCGNSTEPIMPARFVCHQRTKGMATPKEVESGMKHIIADCISKDKGIRDLVRKLKNSSFIMLVCTKSKTTAKPNTKKKSPAKATKQSKSKPTTSQAHSTDDESKYQNYFDFRINVKLIRPHQVLAINRGEKHKFLSVKIDVPKSVHAQLYQQIRAELTQIAECASIDVFAANLKNLLLQPPFRGKVVMGIDPGYRNGCKMAVISARGNVLRTDVIYPDFNAPDLPFHQDTAACKLVDCVLKFRCETIALGNGTACRETEEYLSRLIQSGCFKPFDVVYTIVSEQGASIYSCSPEAQKEFPDLDVNLISAVSIARRLQDPMGEFVKIEARHLGVGMYQHDLPDSKLRSTLDEVVVECVSFVGVDLNVASHSLLRRIAGLNATRAQNIIDWRNSNGPFCNREQIKEVKGIGGKTFEQCAGFVRILPQSCRAHRLQKTETAVEILERCSLSMVKMPYQLKWFVAGKQC
ncbi:hypothetical protein J437_LFUL007588 [Ladona fulva]|uniref:YqgF/RNase H-like domain-containing protein n=1 Tax=Ladona fulva TaxID=123851 RepID=A0A8K0KAT5_LADFU|nr:hypothetical protein J437_LFUL007588 [Ladona fulva]